MSVRDCYESNDGAHDKMTLGRWSLESGTVFHLVAVTLLVPDIHRTAVQAFKASARSLSCI